MPMKGDDWELNDAAKAAAAAGAAPAVVPVVAIAAVPQIAQAIEVQAVPIQALEVQATKPGRWRSDLCGCCEDCCSCCAVFWCFGIPVGQLWERLKGPKGVCLWIVIGFVVVLGIEMTLHEMEEQKLSSEWEAYGYDLGMQRAKDATDDARS